MVNSFRSSILDTRSLKREEKSLNSKVQLWMLVPLLLNPLPRGEREGVREKRRTRDESQNEYVGSGIEVGAINYV
jgi:hypothetical protein